MLWPTVNLFHRAIDRIERELNDRRRLAKEDRVGAKIEVTRLELSAVQPRRLASRSQDGRLARRILAIALVLEGWSRAEAAEACGMDRQTRRD